MQKIIFITTFSFNKGVCSLVVSLFLLANISCFGFSLEEFKEHFHKYNNNLLEYSVLLKNGDIISGKIIEVMVNDEWLMVNEGSSQANSNNNQATNHLKIETFAGIITIYEDEIIKIKIKKGDTRQNHSLYLMPTANPIGNNHFIGNYELVLIYGGVGITDYFSLTAGHTMIPETRPGDQISLINAKVSLPPITDNKHSLGANLRFALGANLAWINAHNKMLHLYGIATFNSFYTNNSNFSVGMFYKAGYQEYPSTVRIMDRPPMTFDYPDGAFGICAGIERRFETRKDLSMIFEIWNSDVANAANTAILLGFRLSGSKVYADFGLSVFTQPFALPFFSFVWMPFN